MARSTPALVPNHNCWRIAHADQVSVIVDADDYFRHARAAMMTARQQLLMIGWDFDGRIRLVEADADPAPATVGDFIEWIIDRTRSLHVHVLRWDTGAVKTLFRGSSVLTLVHWLRRARIHLKLDAHHPVGASHHQKIVVIDDCIAFCGGIDMTADRWDTRAHRDEEPGRTEPGGQPYGPWHDATTALSGPAARTLGELCRDRWRRAGGGALDVPAPTDLCWPEGLAVTFRDCEVAISRTVPEMPGEAPAYEIEALYLDLIARAERWIYAESQYFASHKIAKAIATRLEEKDGPEIVIVNPVSADGWLEPIAMDTARARLVQALRRHDHHGRLRIYHPVTRDGTPIYVHAKVTVIDGEILRVGSSNFNNRSMRLDSECDVTIDATRPENAHAADGIRDVAYDLIAEHCDTDVATVAAIMTRTGSMIATIETLRTAGRRRLINYEIPKLNTLEQAIADSQVLDPEHPDKMFEATSDGGLLRGLVPTVRKSHMPLALAATSVAIGIGLLVRRRR